MRNALAQEPIDRAIQGGIARTHASLPSSPSSAPHDLPGLLSPAVVAHSLQLSAAGTFPNACLQALLAMECSMNKDDRKTVHNAQWAASLMAQKIVSDYQETFGAITPEHIATAQSTCGTASLANPQDYIVSYVLGYLWSGQQAAQRPPLSLADLAHAKDLESLLHATPPKGAQVVTDVSIYLNILKRISVVLSSQQLGNMTD
jgi:hypothetical protein